MYLPTWLFWTALPFTVLGVVFVIFAIVFAYTAAEGMSRGL